MGTHPHRYTTRTERGLIRRYPRVPSPVQTIWTFHPTRRKKMFFPNSTKDPLLYRSLSSLLSLVRMVRIRMLVENHRCLPTTSTHVVPWSVKSYRKPVRGFVRCLFVRTKGVTSTLHRKDLETTVISRPSRRNLRDSVSSVLCSSLEGLS